MSNLPAILTQNILSDYQNEYPATYTAYTTPLVITQDYGGAVACSAIGIARHSFNGHTVTVEYSSDGVSYTTASVFQPMVGRSFLGIFDEQTYRYWKITISGSTDFSFAVIKLGVVLRSERGLWAGVTPPPFNQQASRKPGPMGMGHFLGRQYFARRTQSEFNVKTATSAWVRNNIVDLQDQINVGTGIFYAWRPDDYPSEVVYGFAQKVNSKNEGPRRLMSVDFDVEGLM